METARSRYVLRAYRRYLEAESRPRSPIFYQDAQGSPRPPYPGSVRQRPLRERSRVANTALSAKAHNAACQVYFNEVDALVPRGGRECPISFPAYLERHRASHRAIRATLLSGLLSVISAPPIFSWLFVPGAFSSWQLLAKNNSLPAATSACCVASRVVARSSARLTAPAKQAHRPPLKKTSSTMSKALLCDVDLQAIQGQA